MAIGSAPEIGVTFHRFADMPHDQRVAWFARVREFGPDGMRGMATLAYPDPARIAEIHAEWHHNKEQPDDNPTVDLRSACRT